MPKKKKRPDLPAKKMMQTFFCADVNTRQPLAFTTAASGKNLHSGNPATYKHHSLILT